jgi:DNA-binding PadR family transcriptional regulator
MAGRINHSMPRKAPDLPEHLQKLIPLTPAVFFILLALAEGEMHGYAIMQEVKILSDRRVHMGPGTLYSTIQRLLDFKLIEETAGKPQADPRRRYYRLTGMGKSLLETETGRLEALVRVAQKRKLAIRNAQ